MLRRLFTILSALSLLLCLAAAAIWVEAAVLGRSRTELWGSLRSGVSFHSETDGIAVAVGDMLATSTPTKAFYVFSFPGFHYRVIYGPPRQYFVAAWHGVVVAATALLPLCWMAVTFVAARRRKRRLGLCPSCGYDLRATPGRCPECGTPAAPAR